MFIFRIFLVLIFACLINVLSAQEEPVYIKDLPIRDLIATPQLLLKKTSYRRFSIDHFYGRIFQYEWGNSDIKRKVLYLAHNLGMEYNYHLLEVYIEPSEINQLISALDICLETDLIDRLNLHDGYSYVTRDGLKIRAEKETKEVAYFISLDSQNPQMTRKVKRQHLDLFQKWCLQAQRYFNK